MLCAGYLLRDPCRNSSAWCLQDRSPASSPPCTLKTRRAVVKWCQICRKSYKTHNFMIITVAVCNYFICYHPYLVALLGTGALAHGQAFGAFLGVWHSFVFAVSLQPGFKVGPDLAAMERGKKKRFH